MSGDAQILMNEEGHLNCELRYSTVHTKDYCSQNGDL